MEKQTLMGFVVMSFLVQAMIVFNVTVAKGGINLLDNTEAENTITGLIEDTTDTTDYTIIEDSDYEKLRSSGNIAVDIWAQLWNMGHWIGKMITVMGRFIGDYVTFGVQMLYQGATTDGIMGSIISLFGAIMMIWQVALVAMIIKVIK